MKFIAATASARRHKILRELGVEFEVFVTHCEETHDDDDAIGTVVANAVAKYHEASAKFPDAWILAADTVVEFEGKCIGKPVDMDDAKRMLMAFAGKRQTVFTAVAMGTGSIGVPPVCNKNAGVPMSTGSISVPPVCNKNAGVPISTRSIGVPPVCNKNAGVPMSTGSIGVPPVCNKNAGVPINTGSIGVPPVCNKNAGGTPPTGLSVGTLPMDIRVVASSVMFKQYDIATVEKYLAEANVLDRAGAYDIDTMGDVVVAGWTGSFTNIMGLPAETVNDWLKANNYFNN